MNSMDSQILERVRGIAADVLQVNQGSLNAESSPQSVESWDSVQHLNLVLAVEQQLGIQFAPEEIEQMQSVGAIIEVAQHKLNQ